MSLVEAKVSITTTVVALRAAIYLAQLEQHSVRSRQGLALWTRGVTTEGLG